MTPEGRVFLRDLGLMIGVPLVLAIGLGTWLVPWRALLDAFVVARYVPPDGNTFTVAAGRWDWTGKPTFCQGDFHEIRFAPDSSAMMIEHAQPVGDSGGVKQREWVYDIVAWDSTSIRGAIRGETRLTERGEPVVWDLVLTGPNAYRWHRTDWTAEGYTAEVRRCPRPVSLPEAPARGPA